MSRTVVLSVLLAPLFFARGEECSLLQRNSHNSHVGPSEIPCTIHQTWKTHTVDPEARRHVKTWKEKNPSCAYVLWNDTEVAQLVKEKSRDVLWPMWAGLSAREQGNIFRYLVLYEHGGYFADLNVSCDTPIEDFGVPKETKMIIGYEWPYRWSEKERLKVNFIRNEQFAKYFMASAPHNPILKRAMEMVRERFTWKIENDMDMAGSALLSDSVHEFFDEHEEGALERENMIRQQPENVSLSLSYESGRLYAQKAWPVWILPAQQVNQAVERSQGEDRRCWFIGTELRTESVMVDVILNHIAAPCPSALEAGYAAVMPCTGWAGSSYGNRRINTQDGWKGPEFFHNILGNLMGNCPVEEPSFTCPQSDPPGDCTQCDFKGLPDWNTGLQGTRETLAKHLMELHDVGVTMIRIDAASYMSWEDTAAIINQLPWDVVHQEWWGGIPAPERSEAVGHYRDQKYGLKITNALAVGDVNYLSEMLNISTGLEGIPSERAVYPLTFHDARTWEADRFIPTFMNGLEFHQQQKFLLAWPKGMAVRLWGGYTFTNMDAGPPGECGNGRCQPFPVYLFEDEEPRCMPTPQNSPLSEEEKEYEGWICEHRWEGIAGLINFRQACRGLPITSIWSSSDGSASLGQYAWRATQGQQQCFAALVRGFNTRWPGPWGHLGDWRLAGMATGLPPGRYCDLASLSTQKCWDRRRCPREVSIDADGVVLTGVVREGDLLAIHTSARLSDSTEPFVCGQTEELSTASSATVPLLVGALAMGFL
ncbi:4-alpha-D-glucan glucanohydrolase) [Durusdinium trenchii]|uniref:4-alpha-D-glucan glucanohydrolase n=1 Tax=Durusdinium trenchii TaxID=1381693 RepID=A0ABP0KGA2_9DINO